MKKIYTALLCLPLFATAITYPGNTRTGFGGTIGTGNLSITDNGTTISFTLTRGTGNFNDAFVIYIDSKSGGFSNTSGFSDFADGLREAISGTDGTSRTQVNFGNGLLPDYAIAIQPTNFGGLWGLANGGANSLSFVTSVNISPNTNSAATYTFSCSKTDLGITGPTVSFDFIGTYISTTAYRADEAIGFDITTGNPGFTGSVSPNAKYQYPSGILLPVQLTNFNGYLKNNNVSLTWTTASENNLGSFDIEQSTDGRTWAKAGTVAGLNNTNGASYNFGIGNFNQGMMLYRLKIIDKNGQYNFSSQVTIKSKGKSNIELLGNTSFSGYKVAIHQPEASVITADIITLDGQRITHAVYQHAGGSGVLNINRPAVTKGMYLLKISSTTNSETFKILVQ